jgi:hypothetical protein
MGKKIAELLGAQVVAEVPKIGGCGRGVPVEQDHCRVAKAALTIHHAEAGLTEPSGSPLGSTNLTARDFSCHVNRQ